VVQLGFLHKHPNIVRHNSRLKGDGAEVGALLLVVQPTNLQPNTQPNNKTQQKAQPLEVVVLSTLPITTKQKGNTQQINTIDILS